MRINTRNDHVKATIILVVMFIFFIACSDDPVTMQDRLEGSWRFEKSCGGFVGCITADQVGTHTLLISDGTVKRFEHDRVTLETGFTLNNDASIGHNGFEMILDDGTVWKCALEDNNMLSIEYVAVTALYSKKRL